MNWNKKELVLEDGSSFEILDTVDTLTCAIAFYFTDSPYTDLSEKLTELTQRLAVKHVAVLAFADPKVLFHPSKTEEGVYPSPDDTKLLQKVIDSLCSMYYTYTPWFLCFAEDSAAELLYADLRFRKKPAFLQYCLVKEAPEEEPDPSEDYRYKWIEVFFSSDKPVSGICFPPKKSRVSFLSEDHSPENICKHFFSALRHAKKMVWDFMMEDLRTGNAELWKDLSDQEYIDRLITMTLDFEGCADAAAWIFHTQIRLEPDDILEQATVRTRKILKYDSKLWPDHLFWLIRAADCCCNTVYRVWLFNEYLDYGTMQKRLPDFVSEIAGGHSYAAIFCGLAAEMGYIHDPEKTDLDLAKYFYRQAVSLGDPEGWYRLGRLAEYSENRNDEALECYKKAADADFLPALMKLVQQMEALPGNQKNDRELLKICESIIEIIELRTVYMKMGHLKEASGNYSHAADYYFYATECEEEPLSIEKAWQYAVTNDKAYGVILLDPGVPETEKDAYFHLGRILSEHPEIDAWYDLTPADCFKYAEQ